MNLLKRTLSLCLLLLLLVETAGFNHLQHCCGYDEIVSVFDEDMADSCVDAHAHHHDDHTAKADHHALQADCSCLSDHHTLQSSHHHAGNCLHADYILLKTETLQKSIASVAQVAIPMVIQLFDFEPSVEQDPYFHHSSYQAKIEPGRAKLSLFATLLI